MQSQIFRRNRRRQNRDQNDIRFLILRSIGNFCGGDQRTPQSNNQLAHRPYQNCRLGVRVYQRRVKRNVNCQSNDRLFYGWGLSGQSSVSALKPCKTTCQSIYVSKQSRCDEFGCSCRSVTPISLDLRFIVSKTGWTKSGLNWGFVVRWNVANSWDWV